jgi:glycosyltransferase involved in cell wall biosynthesis
MKILFFSPYYLPYISGITTYPSTLFQRLDKKHKITILCFPHDKKLAHKETIDDTTIVRMPYLLKISKGYISPQSLWYFYNQAKQNDIVLLNIPNFEGIFLAFIVKLLRKKVISIFHCEVILGNSVWEKIISSILNISVYLQLLISDTIVGYTKDYVTSRDISKRFLSKFRFVYPPVQLLPVDKQQIETVSRKKNKTIWVGYAGRIAREKGITYLINAAQILKDKGMNIKLMFAGPYGKQVAGEEQYYEEIISLLKNTDIEYDFLGSLREKELSTFYSTIDVLVLPSINQTEAFGLVQVDAMMLGTPVIATDLPGVRVPVNETKMGIIVKPTDSLKLSQAIEEITKNRSRYSDPELIKYAQDIFNIHKTYDFYDKLLNAYILE